MNQKGQSLIEALIALGAAVVIVSAITVAVITAVSNSDFAKYQNLATSYAQQGIQVVEQKSQLDWVDTATYSGTWCLPQGAVDFYPAFGGNTCPVNITNKFVRELDFTKISPCSTPDRNSPCCVPSSLPGSSNPQFCANNPEACSSRVKVIVKWTDGKCSTASDFCHHTILDSCITDIDRTQ